MSHLLFLQIFQKEWSWGGEHGKEYNDPIKREAQYLIKEMGV